MNDNPPSTPAADPAERRKADTRAQEQAGLACLIGDRSQCRILDSIEDLGGGRRVLQSNCSTCGNGCARRLAEGETVELRTGALYEPKADPPAEPPRPEEPPPKRKKK
jgi:hypothetical protein